MTGLNEFLRDFLFGLGGSTLFLLAIRLLPDFARNLILLLASIAAIELFTSPFYTFGMIAFTGLIYYGLFWLQWNPKKAFFCRLIIAAAVAVLLALMVVFRLGAPSILIGIHALATAFLTFRLIRVAHSVGRGDPLPSDPLEFFVYAFFFPTFFLGPLERLDAFRKNLTSEHRLALSWKQTGLQAARIALGLAKIGLAVYFLPREAGFLVALNLYAGLSGIYDAIMGCTGLAGYRLSDDLNAFPQGTLISRTFLFHGAVVGGIALWLKASWG